MGNDLARLEALRVTMLKLRMDATQRNMPDLAQVYGFSCIRLVAEIVRQITLQSSVAQPA